MDYDPNQLSLDKIKSIVNKYAQEFGVPKTLAIHLARTIEKLFGTNYLIGNLPHITQEKFIVVTHDAPNSKIISADELAKMKNDSNTLFIRNGILSFKETTSKINNKGFELLKILLKYPQEVFSYADLEEKISGRRSKYEHDSRRYIQQIKSRLCSSIPELGEYIGTQDGYYLMETLEYCIFEKIILVSNDKNNEAI